METDFKTLYVKLKQIQRLLGTLTHLISKHYMLNLNDDLNQPIPLPIDSDFKTLYVKLKPGKCFKKKGVYNFKTLYVKLKLASTNTTYFNAYHFKTLYVKLKP